MYVQKYNDSRGTMSLGKNGRTYHPFKITKNSTFDQKNTRQVANADQISPSPVYDCMQFEIESRIHNLLCYRSTATYQFRHPKPYLRNDWSGSRQIVYAVA